MKGLALALLMMVCASCQTVNRSAGVASTVYKIKSKGSVTISITNSNKDTEASTSGDKAVGTSDIEAEADDVSVGGQ